MAINKYFNSIEILIGHFSEFILNNKIFLLYLSEKEKSETFYNLY